MQRFFGDMLLDRRRQLGLSLQQVANAIKIRPQIIEFIEAGDFTAMPPRGYAQGIISSYARYLGLNSREVVDAYFDALHEFERTGAHGRIGRFQDAAADPNPRSSNAQGRYFMVNNVPQSRYAQRPQQAGYVSESASPHEPVSSSRLRPAAIADARRARPGGYDASLRSRTNGRAADPYGPRRGAGDPRMQGGAPYPRDGRPPRRGQADMRSGQGGRRPYGAPAGRPPQNGRGGRGTGAPAPAPLDPRLLIGAAAVALLIIALLVMLLLRGCAPKETPAGSTDAPSVSAVDKKGEGADSDSGADEDPDQAEDEDADASADDASAADEDDAKAKEPKETKVKVKVKEKGAVAWIEVKLDGKIVLGKEVVGPFDQEFTVTSQIDITTTKPADVTVYKNGEKVSYDTRVSGVAKVSIVAPKPEPEKVVDSDGDGKPDMTIEEAQQAGVPIPDDVAAAANEPASNQQQQ